MGPCLTNDPMPQVVLVLIAKLIEKRGFVQNLIYCFAIQAKFLRDLSCLHTIALANHRADCLLGTSSALCHNQSIPLYRIVGRCFTLVPTFTR